VVGTDSNHGTIFFMVLNMDAELLTVCSCENPIERCKRSKEWAWNLVQSFSISNLNQAEDRAEDEDYGDGIYR
jgi:hypothetical protein